MTVKILEINHFEKRSNGIFYRNYDGERIKISDAVTVSAIVSNPDSTKWGKIIEFNNLLNEKVNLIVPMKLIMSTSRYLAAELSSCGLKITGSMLCARLLQEYLINENPKHIRFCNNDFSLNYATFIRIKAKKSDRREICF